MKTKLFTLALMLLATAVFAQTKKELLTAKKWNYSGIEEFGVVKPPDSTMKNDNIALMADGSFIMIKKNKKLTGTWSYNEKTGLITFTDGASKKGMSYNLKSVDEKELVIEYQAPDLVRTRYRYQAVQ
jgi:hypothetical protein